MNTKPPRLAEKLLLWFLRRDLAEEVLGDLDEKFYSALDHHPSWRARLNYWYQVFNYLRPFAIQKSRSTINNIDMFKSFCTIALRNLARHKMYSAINIGGFAVGIAACLMLALYIKSELSYDKHYDNASQIYRVIGNSTWDGVTNKGVHFAHPFSDALKEYPDFEAVGIYNPVNNFGAGDSEIRRTDRTENTHESGIIFADQGLLDVLEAKFIHGNSSSALSSANSVVITQKIAAKYFLDENPVGKTLILNNDETNLYTVTGVIENFPSQSHFNYNILLTLEGKIFFEGERDNWCCNNYIAYVRLEPRADAAAVEQKLQAIVGKYIIPEAIKAKEDEMSMKWRKSFTFSLQPVREIYMNGDLHDDLSHGDIRFIWLFGSIAAFILFMACINFINLSTARSASRAKEVGIRKSIGSARGILIRQFLTESIVFSLMAVILGMLLTVLCIPAFNHLVGKSLAFPWLEWWLVPSIIAMSIMIGIIAGVYPAFYLSAFRPVHVLKGTVSTGARNVSLRSSLVIFQFTISIVLIVGTIVVSRQMDYMLTKDLGFDKERVMILHGTVTLGTQIGSFKNELLQESGVQSATISNYIPVSGAKRDGGDTRLEGKDPRDGVNGQQWWVDHDYIKTMGLKIVKGRDFDAKITSDSQAMIVNQSLVREMKLSDPIGQRVVNYAGVFTIIGVVEDFHFESLKTQITPVTMNVRKSDNIVSVKMSSSDPTATIEAITAVWKKFSPNQPIRFEFLDDRYARTYDDLGRFGLIVTIFTTLAIIVACLGLFALSAFMIEQRSKEISIRMVLGAPLSNILRLLTQNFMMLVLISFFIATPLAWYAMNFWLQDYAYKVGITWEVFVLTGVTAIIIALLTIGYQSIRASLANPADKLKSE